MPKLLDVRRAMWARLKHQTITVPLEEGPVVAPDVPGLLSHLLSVSESDHRGEFLIAPGEVLGRAAAPPTLHGTSNLLLVPN
eukprot:14818510-Alexandrium_andersonii.AAC.1